MKSLTMAAVIVLILIGHARAGFLGLAPGDYNITLQDIGTPYGRGPLNNLTGQVHIPEGDVTADNFAWRFALVDCCGQVTFAWASDRLSIWASESGASGAYEENK